MKTYSTEEAALKRVQLLRKLGIWPAVVKIGTGQCYRLLFDPDAEDDQ